MVVCHISTWQPFFFFFRGNEPSWCMVVPGSGKKKELSLHIPETLKKNKILRCYSEQFYGNTFENSCKMDKLFE